MANASFSTASLGSHVDRSEPVFQPTALPTNDLGTCVPDTYWYDCWVRHQLESQPKEIYFVLQEEKHTDPFRVPIVTFMKVWHKVWAEASEERFSIEIVISQLREAGYIKTDVDFETENRARNLVFAIIGWQTMLYRPDMGSCSADELAIVDETDDYRGHAFMKLRQDQVKASKVALHELLFGFGMLLPGRNFDGLASYDDEKPLTTTKNLSSDSFNMHLIQTIGGIQIIWVDSLACHLEFDSESRILFLFRYPSFCSINLLSQKKNQAKSTLHACAAPSDSHSLCGDYDDINNLLQEILLSYRLLFGQNKASRQMFRSLKPFKDLPENCRDKSLSELCGTSQINLAIPLRERGSYLLKRDFPLLRSRLASLAQHLSSKRPKTWRELWNDKRDSASWLTFWAVLVIGGVGIILAFMQVILQIVQVSLQVKGTRP